MNNKPANTSDTQQHASRFVRVAIPSPLRQLFDYLPNDSHPAQSIQPGARVLVPFGHRQMVGIVTSIETSTTIPADKLKPLIS
ncbi:hypothetical protein, partial [Endozoicomonas sp.]|uniref:primosomal protein N' family DNA-binding protein n=1 Tax=Endozoicomonas sp. TaxID=1892382 RepID=UPI00383BC6EF